MTRADSLLATFIRLAEAGAASSRKASHSVVGHSSASAAASAPSSASASRDAKYERQALVVFENQRWNVLPPNRGWNAKLLPSDRPNWFVCCFVMFDIH